MAGLWRWSRPAQHGPPQIESDLYCAAPTRRASVSHRFVVATKRVVGGHESLEVCGADELEGEVKGRPRATRDALGSIGVRTKEGHLALPKRRQIDAHGARHPNEDDAPALTHDLEGLCKGLCGSDAIENDVRTAREALDFSSRARDGEGARDATNRAGHLVGFYDQVGTESSRKVTLNGVLGDGDNRRGQEVRAQRGDRQKTKGARTQNDGVLSRCDVASRRRMDRARRRFHQNGGVIGEALWNTMDLRIVSDELFGPTSASIRAKPGLQARFDMAKGDAFACALVSRCARGTRWVDLASETSKDRLDDHARTFERTVEGLS
jgi:hypothetical protein